MFGYLSLDIVPRSSQFWHLGIDNVRGQISTIIFVPNWSNSCIALYCEKNSVEGSIVLFRGSYCCDALHSYFILRIYSATQGYNVVLCCIILKVAIKGCIVLFRGGGEGHIGVRIRGVCSTT